jgi:hypothetical protein
MLASAACEGVAAQRQGMSSLILAVQQANAIMLAQRLASAHALASRRPLLLAVNTTSHLPTLPHPHTHAHAHTNTHTHTHTHTHTQMHTCSAQVQRVVEMPGNDALSLMDASRQAPGRRPTEPFNSIS